MTVVVREDLCVYVGGAWALWGRSLFKGVEGTMGVTACLTPVCACRESVKKITMIAKIVVRRIFC